MITITINGKRQELEKHILLADFLRSRGINLRFVAVAHNGEVLERENFDSVTLDQDDEIEVVSPVGGG